jgi:hypothetical protein
MDPLAPAMKVLSVGEAKNRFGAFLDAARREAVVVTRSSSPRTSAPSGF